LNDDELDKFYSISKLTDGLKIMISNESVKVLKIEAWY